MNSNITIHVVEPGSDLPVPDTGLFTHGVGGKEAAIITIFSLAIIASLFAIYYYHKKHKQAKKRSILGLFILALLVSLGTFAAFISNSSQSNISAIDLNEQQADLIVDAENTETTEIIADDGISTSATPTPEDPLGEYQSSTTTSTEGTNIIIPVLIATSTALGTSALVLLAYKSRHKEE